jgi:hypothetical protein
MNSHDNYFKNEKSLLVHHDRRGTMVKKNDGDRWSLDGVML